MAYEYEISLRAFKPPSVMELSTTLEKVNHMNMDILAKADEIALKLGYLPPCVKSISPMKRRSAVLEFYVLVEQKPSMRTIQWSPVSCNHDNWCDDDYDDDGASIIEHEPTSFDIPIPWQHWFLKFSSEWNDIDNPQNFRLAGAHLLFSKERITNLDHKFYIPWLSNTMYPFVYGGTHNEGLMTESGKKTSIVESCSYVDLSKFEHLTLGHNATSNFNHIWESFYSSFWNEKFNCDTYSTMAFLNSYGTECPPERCPDCKKVSKTYQQHSSNCLGDNAGECSYEAYSKLSNIPFEKILDDSLFKNSAINFSYMDWVTEISSWNESLSFDFKEMFESALDFSRAVQCINPNYKIVTFEEAPKPNAASKDPYHLDLAGRWRTRSGRYASLSAVKAWIDSGNVTTQQPSPIVVDVNTNGTDYIVASNSNISASPILTSADIASISDEQYEYYEEEEDEYEDEDTL